MDVLTNPVKDYPWGSLHHIARLTGRPPGGPEAEMWLGAHPAGPRPSSGTGGGAPWTR
nr:hypothetical protein GCM10020093_050470 [Planobispora longispora]